ncbi:hypothetical protein PAXRUDRAFT_829095 [Paxillus rubicundulus Ve08.2h10]|uniref:Uncharacterized protein n=1 Tax=Paxillus rubicundulus Ve08.2h10 TaxID=930991 RepID=A0A0D0E0I1_9AGAM|nr:hypothetical protein PAXRUDRAFT_829095 [Paxillus rubicundulus Ve08.2h10]
MSCPANEAGGSLHGRKMTTHENKKAIFPRRAIEFPLQRRIRSRSGSGFVKRPVR